MGVKFLIVMNKRIMRLNRIVEYLEENKSADVRDLSGQLQVSEMTIRRDLKILEDQNVILSKHGGVYINPGAGSGKFDMDYTLPAAGTVRIAEKKRIAAAAASMLEPEDVITIDSGSTMEILSRIIPLEFPLTVLCYSLNVLNEMTKKKNSQILFAGGLFHERSQMFESPEGLSIIKRTRAVKAFVSASGANAELGVTTKIHHERAVKEAIMESSQTKILLLDSSKFGKVQTNYFASLEDFDIIITDTGISEVYESIIRDHGIELHIV